MYRRRLKNYHEICEYLVWGIDTRASLLMQIEFLGKMARLRICACVLRHLQALGCCSARVYRPCTSEFCQPLPETREAAVAMQANPAAAVPSSQDT